MLQRKTTILLHVLVSVLIVGPLVGVVFVLWYPSPYFRISGVEQVLKILVGVQIVLGPLLTVYLYKPGKKGLWFDMCFVAVVQFVALVYCTAVIYEQRPLFVVFSGDRFAVLPEADLVTDGAPIAACPASARPPCLAVAVMPRDAEQRSDLLMKSLEEGIELEQQPQYWQPLAEARAEVLDEAKSLELLASASQQADDGVARVLARTGRSAASMRWVPVVNKRLDAFALVIDAETGEPLDVVNVDPWEPGA